MLTDLTCQLSYSGRLVGVLDTPSKWSIDLGNSYVVLVQRQA